MAAEPCLIRVDSGPTLCLQAYGELNSIPADARLEDRCLEYRVLGRLPAKRLDSVLVLARQRLVWRTSRRQRAQDHCKAHRVAQSTVHFWTLRSSTVTTNSGGNSVNNRACLECPSATPQKSTAARGAGPPQRHGIRHDRRDAHGRQQSKRVADRPMQPDRFRRPAATAGRRSIELPRHAIPPWMIRAPYVAIVCRNTSR